MTTINKLDCSTSLSCDSCESKDERGRVSFNKISIREYPRTLGDNPSVSVGPPLTLDWDYNTAVFSIEDYEANRPERRTKENLVLPRNLRVNILKYECGISRSEMAESIRKVNAVKANRRQTANNLAYSKTEEKIEKVKRALGRAVCIGTNQEKSIERLWEEASNEHKRIQ